jgi:hypothetical protein
MVPSAVHWLPSRYNLDYLLILTRGRGVVVSENWTFQEAPFGNDYDEDDYRVAFSDAVPRSKVSYRIFAELLSI